MKTFSTESLFQFPKDETPKVIETRASNMPAVIASHPDKTFSDDMMSLDNVIQLIPVQDTELIDEPEEKTDRYMFFENIKKMKRQAKMICKLDEEKVASILDNGHDWAQDHIAQSSKNLDEVFDFLMTKLGE